MSIPTLGARTLRIVSIEASEPVRIRLLMTEVGRQSRQNVLLRRSFSTGKGVGVAHSLPLRKDVQRGLLIITGIARDRAGNATRLPQCVIDPVSGRASCTFP